MKEKTPPLIEIVEKIISGNEGVAEAVSQPEIYYLQIALSTEEVDPGKLAKIYFEQCYCIVKIMLNTNRLSKEEKVEYIFKNNVKLTPFQLSAVKIYI